MVARCKTVHDACGSTRCCWNGKLLVLPRVCAFSSRHAVTLVTNLALGLG